MGVSWAQAAHVVVGGRFGVMAVGQRGPGYMQRGSVPTTCTTRPYGWVIGIDWPRGTQGWAWRLVDWFALPVLGRSSWKTFFNFRADVAIDVAGRNARSHGPLSQASDGRSRHFGRSAPSPYRILCIKDLDRRLGSDQIRHGPVQSASADSEVSSSGASRRSLRTSVSEGRLACMFCFPSSSTVPMVNGSHVRLQARVSRHACWASRQVA